jgi:outer membrane protein assembly factor BamB
MGAMDYREHAGPPQVVIVGGEDLVIGLHPENGAELWRFAFAPDVSAGHPVRLAVSGDRVYALSRNWLACLDAATGRVIGGVQTEGALTMDPGVMIVTADRILVNQGGLVQCFSLDGRALWKTRAGFGGALACGEQVAQEDRGGGG